MCSLLQSILPFIIRFHFGTQKLRKSENMGENVISITVCGSRTITTKITFKQQLITNRIQFRVVLSVLLPSLSCPFYSLLLPDLLFITSPHNNNNFNISKKKRKKKYSLR